MSQEKIIEQERIPVIKLLLSIHRIRARDAGRSVPHWSGAVVTQAGVDEVRGYVGVLHRMHGQR